MTKTIANLEQDHCKDDEIKFLEQMAESIPTNSYLRDLFSPKMVAWVKEQICNDFATNLYQFYKEEARENETLNKMVANARTIVKELEDKLEKQKTESDWALHEATETQNKRITELETENASLREELQKLKRKEKPIRFDSLADWRRE